MPATTMGKKKITVYQKISNRIRVAMKDSGFTITTLAQALGKSRSWLHDKLNYHPEEFRLYEISTIFRLLNVEPDDELRELIGKI